jgi:hypothetical protein
MAHYEHDRTMSTTARAKTLNFSQPEREIQLTDVAQVRWSPERVSVLLQ